jgi:glutamyl-tRNA synthetase
MTVRTRFAPSPTGTLHIGGVRTALYSWLHARKHGGQFILRIEDTDRERSTPESVNQILQGMAWLGLDWDEGPFYQTERFARYGEVIDQLLAEDKAYYCYCSKEELEYMRAEQRARGEKPRYDRRCRNGHGTVRPDVKPVVRFKNPIEGSVVVDDAVKGRVVINNDELDDLIIARADGTPTYNLTVVVDDMDMRITHVIRGDDHLNNTPRQINMLTALGAKPPLYAHVPMILGTDGQRLSKRHGAVGVLEFRDQGLLPEALINYLVRLGWSHGDQEIFSLDEMVEYFDIADVNKSASAFNPEKLAWLNQHYLKSSPPEHVASHLRYFLGKLGIDPQTGPDPADVVLAQRERSKSLAEMADKSVYFYRAVEEYDEKAAAKHLNEDALPVLRGAREALAKVDAWRAEALHAALLALVEELELSFGKLAQPLRVALTGGTVSPPIDATLALLGRERSLERIDRALEFAGSGQARSA